MSTAPVRPDRGSGARQPRSEPARIAPASIDAAGRPRWVEREPSAAAPGKTGGRSIAALDGLRAVAVVLVLAGHGGMTGLSGGFIGVDVFFVLSGFLITCLLLEELGRSGRIDVTGFWIRRAKRLLPALLVMVLAVVAARQLFPPEAVARLRDDAVAAFLWVANWNFVAQDTDYFAHGAPPSPLEHTWSLGVEEQFYLLWPLVVIALAVLLAARARRRLGWVSVSAVRVGVVVLAVAGAAGSAVAAVLLVSESSLNRVYFGTDTRVQALLLGAAVAALLVRDWRALAAGRVVIRSRWLLVVARALPVIGLAVLVAAAHEATGSTADFRRGLLIVVAVAAAAVVAGVAFDQRGPVARVLALPPMVALGAISYGVYLWHWPVFLVVNGERTGWSGLALFAARCAVTLVLAVASWWVIEQPVRRWRPTHIRLLPLSAATAATAVALTVLVVPAGTMSGGFSSSTAAGSGEVMRRVDPAALSGPRPHTVAVFGDSIAWTLTRYLPPTPGIEFIDRTTIGCGIARGGPYRYFGEVLSQKPECDAWPSRWSHRIAHDRPDVALLIVGRWEVVNRVWRGDWTHIGDDEFDEYLRGEMRRALEILGSTGARVVVATMPYSRRGEKPDGSLHPEDRPGRVDQWNALMRKVISNRPNVSVIDLNTKLSPRGSYTPTVDGVRVRSDGVHFTPEGVKWLTPWLEESVR